jgi:hypothetical protein
LVGPLERTTSSLDGLTEIRSDPLQWLRPLFLEELDHHRMQSELTLYMIMSLDEIITMAGDNTTTRGT